VPIRRLPDHFRTSFSIQGGISHTNKLYNNFVAFSLTKKYWLELTIAKVEPKLLEGFAKHKMMSIMLPRKKYSIYDDDPVICTEEERNQIKH
jgi:hypothetical protein